LNLVAADEMNLVSAAEDEVISVHEAVDGLAAVDAQAAQVVKLHFFAGLTLEDVASLLEISSRTAYRDWAFARAWLAKRLDGPENEIS
jgi:DNA-directed RNA polymerase specialized sigma24 family protein